MKLRYQYRIYPTRNQQTKLAKTFGCCRVVWNDALTIIKAIPKGKKWPTNSELQRLVITQAKKNPHKNWLAEVSVVALQQAVIDLGTAFKNFFESRSGKRQGPRIGFPRFKKKANQQSARFTQRGFSIKGNQVYLAKIGTIKTKWSRPLPSEPSSVTVIKDRCGRYFFSFVVEHQPSSEEPISPSVGVDLGIKTFAVLSTGEKVQAPDYRKLSRKIRRAQSVLSRRQKGSKRRERARLKVARLKAQLRDLRKDFLHKLSSQLVKQHEVICLEDLNVSGMLKNRKLSRVISEAGWSELRTMCEAKSTMYGRETRVISRWEPTSQYCSDCGYRWGRLDLSVRELVCLGCGTKQDRDSNAAKNIDNVGVGRIHDAKRTGSECKTSWEAVCDEPSIPLVAEQLNLFAS